VTAAAYDIQLEQGETWQPVWSLTLGGAPFPLTNWQAHLQMRSIYYSPTPLVDLHSSSGGIILGGAAGTVQPILAASASAELISGPVVISRMMNKRPVAQLGSYDLKLTDPSGNVYTFMGGNVWITPQTTVGGS
jgi:hypothetical protein